MSRLELRPHRRRSGSRRANTSTATYLARQARAKRSGGPEDIALYRCGCGFQFTAEVTTSVPCPHCGTTQAW